MVRKPSFIVACGVLAMLLTTPVRAASIEVAPVVIDLTAEQQTAVITLVNRTTAPTAAQLRAFAWRQSTTQEELLPTDQLLVSPPVFNLAPGASQLVRLVLRPANEGAERTFRVVVDEIPPPVPGTRGIQLALRLSLPVFVAAPMVTPPRLTWSLSRDGKLTVANSGKRHERVHDLKLVASDGSTLALQPPMTPYVLAGAERQWTLSRTQHLGGNFRLTGQSLAGAFEEAIRLPAR